MDVVKPVKTQNRQDSVRLVENTSAARQDKLSNYKTGWEHHQPVRRHHCSGSCVRPRNNIQDTYKELAGKCFYQLSQLRAVRGAVTLDASKAVVHAFVSSRVDYCNSVFSLVRVKHLRTLQYVLNSAACVISRRRKYDHFTDVVRDQLH